MFEELPGRADPLVVLSALGCYEDTLVFGFSHWLYTAATMRRPGRRVRQERVRDTSAGRRAGGLARPIARGPVHAFETDPTAARHRSGHSRKSVLRASHRGSDASAGPSTGGLVPVGGEAAVVVPAAFVVLDVALALLGLRLRQLAAGADGRT